MSKSKVESSAALRASGFVNGKYLMFEDFHV